MDRHEARERLGKIAVLASLSDRQLFELADHITWRTAPAHTKVIDILSEAQCVYFISEGLFSVEISTPAGEVVLFRSMPAGEHFGELAVLAGAPRTTTVIAEADGLLAECSADRFLALLQACPAVATGVAAHLARTVMTLSDRVFELSALEARFRLYAELLRLLPTGEVTEEGVRIANAPTHEKLAAAIGAQREVVTRELRAIAEDGIVSIGRRQLLVRQPTRLRQIVERRAGVAASRFLKWPVLAT